MYTITFIYTMIFVKSSVILSPEFSLTFILPHVIHNCQQIDNTSALSENRQQECVVQKQTTEVCFQEKGNRNWQKTGNRRVLSENRQQEGCCQKTNSTSVLARKQTTEVCCQETDNRNVLSGNRQVCCSFLIL